MAFKAMRLVETTLRVTIDGKGQRAKAALEWERGVLGKRTEKE